ncbi:MAG: FlgD immunoglobulin-like domain containing protein [Candidatus Neomarinimicrobiota bacterium]
MIKLLFPILLTLVSLKAQSDSLWTKIIGGPPAEFGMIVRQTQDGDFFVGGESLFGSPNYFDLLLFKANTTGDSLWTRTYGGIDSEAFRSIQQTADNGFALVGETLSFGAGSSDIWLVKTNANGDTLWTKTFGGEWDELGGTILQENDSGYIIVGRTYSFGAGRDDVWLIRADSLGDTLWTKTFGGDSYDLGLDVQATFDGGYIILGVTNSYGSGSEDIWLIKTNGDGDHLWDRTYGGADKDIGYSVKQTADSGYVIAGRTSSFGGGRYNVWLIRTDDHGEEVWTRTIGGNLHASSREIQITDDNGFLVIGTIGTLDSDETRVLLIKVSDEGDIQWTKRYGEIGSSWSGRSLVQTSDGGIVITGTVWSQSTGHNILLMKTNSSGDALSVTFFHTDLTLPYATYFLRNYPNPFNPETTIQFELPAASNVSVMVYDLAGREVIRLVDGYMEPGYHQTQWNGRNASGQNFPSGIYIARLVTPEYTRSIKMLLLK